MSTVQVAAPCARPDRVLAEAARPQLVEREHAPLLRRELRDREIG
jgi:hypothetical protein